MTNQPITPPPELVQQWVAEIWHEGTPVRVSLSDEHIATRAAQWGADQEMEACLGYAGDNGLSLSRMRAARRPKPSSLKKQALQELDKVDMFWATEGFSLDTIRKALEALDDLR